MIKHTIISLTFLLKFSFIFSYEIQIIDNSTASLGEGPHWDAASQSLYYVDIDNASLMRFDFKTSQIFKCKIEDAKFASFVIPVENTPNLFLVGDGSDVITVKWDGSTNSCKKEKLIAKVDARDSRFNDGKCDPIGRLIAGTMSQTSATAHLYRYNSGSMESIVQNRTVSNGLAWNKTVGKMYYADSADNYITEFDYDFDSGIPSKPKILFDLRNYKGKTLIPDGMTKDMNGQLYIATWNGHSIYVINPETKTEVQRIDFPCEHITSAAFGGPNLDVLFVTSSSNGQQPHPAGSLFKVSGLKAKGVAAHNCKL